MSLNELYATLQALPRPEKLQAIQFLTERLLEEDKLLAQFQPGASYPVWSPHDSFQAADILHKMLEADRQAP